MDTSLIHRDRGETLDDMAERFGYQSGANLQNWLEDLLRLRRATLSRLQRRGNRTSTVDAGGHARV